MLLTLNCWEPLPEGNISPTPFSQSILKGISYKFKAGLEKYATENWENIEQKMMAFSAFMSCL